MDVKQKRTCLATLLIYSLCVFIGSKNRSFAYNRGMVWHVPTFWIFSAYVDESTELYLIRELPPDLQRLSDLCDATDNLLNTLYGDCDLKKGRVIVDEWLKKEPDALYFMRADIFLKLEEENPDGTDELLVLCDRYLQKYEKDGDLDIRVCVLGH